MIPTIATTSIISRLLFCKPLKILEEVTDGVDVVRGEELEIRVDGSARNEFL